MKLFETKFWAFIKRDAVYIILLLLALMALIYTSNMVKDFENQCNDNYLNYINNNCVCGFEEEPFKLKLNTSKYDGLLNLTGGKI